MQLGNYSMAIKFFDKVVKILEDEVKGPRALPEDDSSDSDDEDSKEEDGKAQEGADGDKVSNGGENKGSRFRPVYSRASYFEVLM